MAEKFSELPPAGSITGAEILACVQGGASKQATAQAIVSALLALVSGAPNGVAPLDANSKIPTANLPALAVTTVSVVASEADQLALTAQSGDVAVRTDISTTFIHNGGDAGTLADWTQWLAPAAPVQSVNGKTGNVALTPTDIGAVPSTAPGAVNGVAQLDASQQLVTAQRRRKEVDLGTLAADTNIDLSTGDRFKFTLGANITITWTNLPPTGCIADPDLLVTQDPDTVYTLTIAGTGTYAGEDNYAGPAAVGQIDLIGYEVDSEGAWLGLQVENI